MKNITTGLILWSVAFCGSLFAQERGQFGTGASGGAANNSPSENVLIVAQGQPAPPPVVRTPLTRELQVQPPPAPISGSGGGGSAGGVSNAIADRVAAIMKRSFDGGHGGGIPFEPPTKRTLIVSTRKMDEDARKNIQEDMQIMSLVLDKAAERALDSAQDRRLGIVVKTLPGAHGQNIFMEDSGALFILNVPIPLAGPKKAAGAPEAEENSDWEQAKRELSQKRAFGTVEPINYDVKKVEALKTALLEALKNAANIRQLKADQSITVAVSGPEDSRTMVTKQSVNKSPGEPPKEQVFHHVTETKGLGGRSVTMTIRVKKSDVDAFAQGKMDFEEFAKKASVSSN